MPRVEVDAALHRREEVAVRCAEPWTPDRSRSDDDPAKAVRRLPDDTFAFDLALAVGGGWTAVVLATRLIADSAYQHRRSEHDERGALPVLKRTDEVADAVR